MKLYFNWCISVHWRQTIHHCCWAPCIVLYIILTYFKIIVLLQSILHILKIYHLNIIWHLSFIKMILIQFYRLIPWLVHKLSKMSWQVFILYLYESHHCSIWIAVDSKYPGNRVLRPPWETTIIKFLSYCRPFLSIAGELCSAQSRWKLQHPKFHFWQPPCPKKIYRHLFISYR